MSNEQSGIILSAIEEKMLQRLQYANALLSEKKDTTEEIAQRIKERFEISIWTARKDITNCYALFAEVTDDYKRYTLIHHIEFIEQQLQRAKDDKSLAGLIPKLLAEKTRAIMAMPSKIENPDLPAPIVNLHTTTTIISPMDLTKAMEQAEALIKAESEKEYIDFEEEGSNERAE